VKKRKPALIEEETSQNCSQKAKVTASPVAVSRPVTRSSPRTRFLLSEKILRGLSLRMSLPAFRLAKHFSRNAVDDESDPEDDPPACASLYRKTRKHL